MKTLLFTLCSILLLSHVSGFFVQPPPSLQAASLYCPITLAHAFVSEDSKFLEIYRHQGCIRPPFWSQPFLAGLLLFHSLLVLLFIIYLSRSKTP